MKHLLLLGGGHAHVHVLRDLAQRPLTGSDVTLVSPYPRQLYSGMVPGLIAGHYAIDDCAIPLQPLADAARVRFVQAHAVALDANARRVSLGDGQAIDYDLLSIDTGPVMPVDAIPGAAQHGCPVRPIERFVERWRQRLAEPGGPPREIALIGGGAAGVELALAMRHRLGKAAAVALVAGSGGLLTDQSPSLQRRARRALVRGEVRLIEVDCTAIDAGALHLADGRILACELAVLAIGAAAAPWLAASGLACNARGFMLTGPTLQSVSHPDVFGAGDAATRGDITRPKNGVHAVRAGPPLAGNLRRHLAGRALREHLPQRRSLALLACGRRHAIASWNGWSIEGDWVWWWKDRIDRGFVERYRLEASAGG